MKKLYLLLALLCITLFCTACFGGAGATPSASESTTTVSLTFSTPSFSTTAEPTSSSESASAPAASEPTPSTSQNLVLDPVTGLPNYAKMKIKGIAKLPFSALGLAMFTYEIDHPEIAEMIRFQDFARHELNLYNPGVATITGSDCFGNQAAFRLTVNTDFTYEIKITKFPSANFREVNQFRFDINGNRRSDHDMIQAAIDAANADYKRTGTRQTVAVYPGTYSVNQLTIKAGVILDMYTTMDKATTGFSATLAEDIQKNRVAILKGGRILNAPYQTSGYEGEDNFTIRGGVLDMDGKGTCFLILGCADNVTVENVVFKDISNNHAVQLTACTNTTIKNCMFAGFKLGNTFTREVVQVEHASAGSTGSTSNGNIPPLTFDDNDPRFSKNVSIEGCYFGKSDEYGAPWMAIGHHSGSNTKKQANVTTFTIKNNVFDDCIYAAIRYNSINGMTISGNKFITTASNNHSVYSSKITEGVPSGNNVPAMIIFYHRNATWDTGMQNVLIENNTFDMGTGVDRRVVYFASSTSYNESITMQNNTINFAGKPTYSDYHVRLTGVKTLTYKSNTVNKPASVTFSKGVDK